MESPDFCSDISVIPQYIGTCWFNAILMNSFYSQAMRKLMIKKVSKTWDKENKENKVLKFFKTILKRSYNTEDKKIIEMFYKTKPQMLLITYANLFDLDFKKTIKKFEYGGFSSYISIFLKKINVKVLDIVYYHRINKCLLNSFKYMDKSSVIINKDEEKKEIQQILDNVPDVLVLYNTKLYDYLDDYNILSFKNVNITIHESDNYVRNDEAIEDIKEYKDEIRLLGHVYKLDSIILENYNKVKGAHAISGITCNNNKYVYNGWCKGTVDPGLKQQEIKKKVKPYPLVKYDWNLREDKSFCFKPEYSETIEEQKLCFSFNKGRRILIYVKDNKEETSSLIRSNSYSNLSSKEEFKKFHNLDKSNREEIILELNEKNTIYDKTLSTEKLNEILMNILKKEAGLFDDEKKYEYFTLLPTEDYKEEELIKIGDNYYLKKNLFYYLFISELDKTFNNLNNSKIVACYTPDDKLIYIDQIKELIFYFFETQDLKKIIENYLRVNETIYSNFEEKINEKFKNLDLLYSIKKLIQVFLNIFGIDFYIKLLNLKDTREFMKYITDEKNNFLENYKDLHNEQTNINDLISYLLDRCNKIETIPFEERFIIDNKTYNLVLLFYCIIYNNSSINLKIEELKLLIFRYYSLMIDDFDSLNKEIDKEENDYFKLNIMLNVNKIKSNKKSNFAKRRKTYNEYPCDMFKNDEQQIKGGRKKLLKKY